MSLVLTSPGQGPNRDPASWFDRLVRLVPSETIAIYGVAHTFFGAHLAFVVGGVVTTVVVLAIHARVHGLSAPVAQQLVRALTFIAWAVVLGPPDATTALIDRRIAASLALVVPALGTGLFPVSRPRR